MAYHGYIVKAMNDEGKVVPVSGPLQSREAADKFLEMYLKSYPQSEPYVEQKITGSDA